MATKASRFDAAPMQDPLDPSSIRWRKWFQDLWSNINAIGLPLPTAITVGGSPFTYQYVGAGQASIIVTGGTVSLVETSRNGTTYFSVATSSPGMFSVSQGDYLRVTYSAAPTMQLVLR